MLQRIMEVCGFKNKFFIYFAFKMVKNEPYMLKFGYFDHLEGKIYENFIFDLTNPQNLLKHVRKKSQDGL